MTDIKEILRGAADMRSTAAGDVAAETVGDAIVELAAEKLATSGTLPMLGNLNLNSNSITSVNAITSTSSTVNGNITVTGSVDGRDLSVDGVKLDGIETSATADQSDAEVKTSYENNSDTNAFTDAEQSKLAGIETNAKNDQVASEVGVTPTGNLSSSDVQAALQELQVDIDGINNDHVWTIVTSNITATAGDSIFADTGTTARVITLPASPAIGDRVTVVDYKGNAATNNITLGRNGSNIHSVADDLLMATDNVSAIVVYSDTSEGWIVTNT